MIALVCGLACPAIGHASKNAPRTGSASKSSMQAKELVVVGRIENLKYDALDDLGISGRITARLGITHVVRGHAPSQVLTFYYIAHSEFAEDRDFRFHLRQSKGGIWSACSDNGNQGYVCR